VGRKLLQSKLLDVELSIRGILRGYGLKVGEVSRARFEARIRKLIAGHVTLSMVIDAMLTVRAALWSEFTMLHCEMLRIARADQVCQRLRRGPIFWTCSAKASNTRSARSSNGCIRERS